MHLELSLLQGYHHLESTVTYLSTHTTWFADPYTTSLQFNCLIAANRTKLLPFVYLPVGVMYLLLVPPPPSLNVGHIPTYLGAPWMWWPGPTLLPVPCLHLSKPTHWLAFFPPWKPQHLGPGGLGPLTSSILTSFSLFGLLVWAGSLFFCLFFPSTPSSPLDGLQYCQSLTFLCLRFILPNILSFIKLLSTSISPRKFPGESSLFTLFQLPTTFESSLVTLEA